MSCTCVPIGFQRPRVLSFQQLRWYRSEIQIQFERYFRYSFVSRSSAEMIQVSKSLFRSTHRNFPHFFCLKGLNAGVCRQFSFQRIVRIWLRPGRVRQMMRDQEANKFSRDSWGRMFHASLAIPWWWRETMQNRAGFWEKWFTDLWNLQSHYISLSIPDASATNLEWSRIGILNKRNRKDRISLESWKMAPLAQIWHCEPDRATTNNDHPLW